MQNDSQHIDPAKEPQQPNSQQGDDGAGQGITSDDPRLANFDVPKFVFKKYADLIELILVTKSMDDKERQYWFHILPIMSEQQVEKLRGILVKEQRKLAEIDAKYSQTGDSKQKMWDEQKLTERFKEIKQQEKSHEQEEKEAEEALLKELDNV